MCANTSRIRAAVETSRRRTFSELAPPHHADRRGRYTCHNDALFALELHIPFALLLRMRPSVQDTTLRIALRLYVCRMRVCVCK